MALIRMTRRAPLAPLTSSLVDELPDRIRRMFDGSLAMEPIEPMGFNPPVEIVEKNGFFVVTAELPGIALKDVNVSFDEGMLTISGEKSEERKEGDKESEFHLWERRYGSFRRTFSLPNAIDADKITAAFDNGVLTVKLPKTERAKTTEKKIAVKAAT